jgi:15-cis-phytoene synthase
VAEYPPQTGRQGGGGLRAIDAKPLSPSLVADALRHCRDVTRDRARNFYYGLKLSPEPQRSALFVIYAWMRTADDLVDGGVGGPASGIESHIRRFRAATRAALMGQPVSDEPLWVGLADTASRFRLPLECFDGMIDGQLDDLAKTEYETFEQLRNYCYRVASTVGLLCIEIWGYESAAARELAIERGIAFQLTNIIRDYKQDFDTGRIYLPREDFEHHGIDSRALRHWTLPGPCKRMMLQQTERAESYYQRSKPLDELISPACRPTLWAMTAIYQGLLAKIRRNPSRLIMTKRLRLSAMHKGTIALRAKWQARAARQLPGETAAISGNSPA